MSPSGVMHVGLDLGGTNIKAVVLERRHELDDLRVVHDRTVPTEASEGPERVSQRLIDICADIMSEFASIQSIGLGVPGVFDPRDGTIECFPNLPGEWKGFELGRTVSAGLGAPIPLVNDARAFTLAEGSIGAGRNAKVMLGITLGTGIGGGIMIDGRLHTGAFGSAGEFGHQTVDPDGPICGCGNQGCLEAVAKASSIAAMAGLSDVDALLDAAVRGDRDPIRAIEQACFHLAIGIANTICLVGVDVVVVGGGVATVGDVILDPLRRAVGERVTLFANDDLHIVAAELGPRAGAVGAALVGSSQLPVR